MKLAMRLFRKRTLGFYLGFASAALMLICTIAFIAMDCTDPITFFPLVVSLLLVGAVSEVAVLLFDFAFLPLLPPLFYAPAVGIHGYLALQSYSDVWNNVHFVGGNGKLALVFWILFLVLAIVSVVSAFLSQYRKEQAEE